MQIGKIVAVLMPQAIAEVSDGGEMKFSARQLFYKVRELFLTKNFVCPICGGQVWIIEFPDLFECEAGHKSSGKELRPLVQGLHFYKYGSFTQDFLTQYQRRNGKILGLIREIRGKYSHPTFWFDYRSYEDDVDTETVGKFTTGDSNAVIMVEKLYRVMRENEFDKRLDKTIIWTQGFSTEAARDMMIRASKLGLKVIVAHDYDVNGVLTLTTLKEPTKRRNSFIEGEVIDLGLTYEQLKRLKVRPEPISLSKEDRGKLEGLFRGGKITEEEYGFLKTHRVELNALTPSQLLRWLEEELESRGLWKTIPSGRELKDEIRTQVEHQVSDKLDSLAARAGAEFVEGIGLGEVQELIDQIETNAVKAIRSELVKRIGKIDIDGNVGELKQRLKDDMLKFWKQIATEMAIEQSDDLKTGLGRICERKSNTWVKRLRKDKQTTDALEQIRKLTKGMG